MTAEPVGAWSTQGRRVCRRQSLYEHMCMCVPQLIMGTCILPLVCAHHVQKHTSQEHDCCTIYLQLRDLQLRDLYSTCVSHLCSAGVGSAGSAYPAHAGQCRRRQGVCATFHIPLFMRGVPLMPRCGTTQSVVRCACMHAHVHLGHLCSCTHGMSTVQTVKVGSGKGAGMQVGPGITGPLQTGNWKLENHTLEG